MMKTPDIRFAVELYYRKPEIKNEDIRKLFGIRSVTRLKRKVNDEMEKRGKPHFLPHSINTKIAYEVWGLDIDDLEKRLAKLKKLGLATEEEQTNEET